jgi:hypothetical protein
LSLGKLASRQRSEHVRATYRTEALPEVCPLNIAVEQLREMTDSQANMYGSDHYCGDRVQHESRQRKFEANSHIALIFHFGEPNSSTVANGSADHGLKRFSVNFVFCPG